MKKLYTLLFFTLFGLNIITAATFSSVSSGTWSAPATWTVTSGTDADGIPDADDDVTINNSHTVKLITACSFKSVIVQSTGFLSTANNSMNIYGNVNLLGKVLGLPTLYFRVNSSFNSASLYSNSGNWWIQPNISVTITSNTSITNGYYINLMTGAKVFNSGIVSSPVTIASGAVWNNLANSRLTLGVNSSGSGSISAPTNSNTVIYNNSSITKIFPGTYYDLVLNASSTKSITTNLTVLNNLTFGAGNNLNANNFNITVGGNFTNNANTNITNQSSFILNGAGTQTIYRASTELFNNLILSGTGTVMLGTNISVNGNLNVSSGTLDVSSSNYTVDIKGNLINNGTINARQGLFSFTGTSAQTISGTQGTSFNDLTSANTGSVTVTSNVAVFYKLSVNSGSFGTAGSGIVTIPASGPNTYARIGTISGSLFGTGWVLESYVNGPAQAGWQWLSSPTSNSTLADWDNDPRFYMSGVGGNDGNAGTFKSVRTYSEPTNTYLNITSTATSLTPGKGFQVWMSDNMTGMTAPLIYNTTGTPNFGTINFPVTAGGAGTGYNLVGNPYACPITYSAVVAASGNLYSSFLILLEDNTYSTDPNGGIISPNQGFMCCAFAGGNIVFNEACKNINGNPSILKQNAPENSLTISVFNNVNGIGGRTTINFTENGTDNFENGYDLSFLSSPSEDADNIYSKSLDEVALLRNVLPNNGEEKHVPLTVKCGVFGSHFISLKGLSNLNLYNSVWLEDLTTGKKVDLLKNAEYEFNAEEIEKNYEFILHFSNSTKSTENADGRNSNLLNENTSVYNTPANVIVKFAMDESTPVSISVFNLAGQKVMETIQTNVTDDRIVLPLQKENGLYLLLIQSGNDQITRKIIY